MRKIHLMVMPFLFWGVVAGAQNLKPVRSNNGTWGFADSLGKEIVAPKYDHASGFNKGVADVVLNGRHGLVDLFGKELVPPRYNYISLFFEGMASVELNGKRGYIDSTGREVVPPKYDGAGNFSEGMGGVVLNNKFGFINKKGEEIVVPRYDFSQDFREGLAAVKLDNKWGFIDRTGKEVIVIKYDRVESFMKGAASVILNAKAGRIDQTGKELVAFVEQPEAKPVREYVSEAQKKEALCKQRWDTPEFAKGITRKWVTGYIILESYNCGTDEYRYLRPQQPGNDPYPSSVNTYSVVSGRSFRESSTKPREQFVTCSSCNGSGYYTYTETKTKVKELPWGYFSGIETKKYTTTETQNRATCKTCKGQRIVLKY